MAHLPEFVRQELFNRVEIVPSGGVLAREVVNFVQRQAATTGKRDSLPYVVRCVWP